MQVLNSSALESFTHKYLLNVHYVAGIDAGDTAEVEQTQPYPPVGE